MGESTNKSISESSAQTSKKPDETPQNQRVIAKSPIPIPRKSSKGFEKVPNSV